MTNYSLSRFNSYLDNDFKQFLASDAVISLIRRYELCDEKDRMTFFVSVLGAYAALRSRSKVANNG